MALVVAGLLTVPAFSAREVVGWAEQAIIYPGKIKIMAKIDTGAETTSLHCERCETYDRNGEPWVRVKVTDQRGEWVIMERRVHRVARIKRHFGEVQERPVIMLGICLGGVYGLTEVNLVDRSGLAYPLLVGRQFLGQRYLVDAGSRHVNPPHC